MDSVKEKSITGFIWRFLQGAGTQIISFIIQIVLARILMPDDYGLVAMITVFVNIAMVFINVGFSSALVQRENITENDKNTAFYSSLAVSLMVYLVLFFTAPFIADFYREKALVELLRVQGIMVILGGLYSVHQSLITRNLEFKKSFIVSLIGITVHGVVGIALALLGFGAWALVISTVANFLSNMISTWYIVKWKPRLMFSVESFKNMVPFSVKMLGSRLLSTVFDNIRSIIIGREYSGEDLAYYNRGYQFPAVIMVQVDGAVTAVLFSSLAKYQSEWETKGIPALRRAMKTSLYVCAPLMFGLCAIAEPMIRVLLTEKWITSAGYMRFVAMMCLFWPLTAKRHALNSIGKSGVEFKINLLEKILMIAALFITFKISINAMLTGSILSSVLSFVISSFVYKKHLAYKISDQYKDVLPPILMSAIMFVATYSVSFIGLPDLITIALQVIVGGIVYVLCSLIFKVDSFFYILNLVKGFLKKEKNA